MAHNHRLGDKTSPQPGLLIGDDGLNEKASGSLIFGWMVVRLIGLQRELEVGGKM